MAEPAITVVVPVRDGADSLGPLLDSLDGQTADDFEVLVVENGSRDGSTAALARGRGARVLEERRANRANARNLGVAAARGRLLAFTDGDCVAEPGWLAALAQCLERTPLAAGPVELTTAEPPNRCERLELLWRFDQQANVREHRWAASANLGIRREAFEAIGGFDPTYRQIGEDVDLCLRAAAAGLELGWCPAARIRHHAERTLGPILKRGFRHGWSSAQHARRMPGSAGWVYWRHPGPTLAGDWALRRFDADPRIHGDLLGLARAEYAARVAGSAWAALRRVA